MNPKLIASVLALMDKSSAADAEAVCYTWALQGFKPKLLPTFLKSIKEIDQAVKIHRGVTSGNLVSLQVHNDAVISLDALLVSNTMSVTQNSVFFGVKITQYSKPVKDIVLKVIQALPDIAENRLSIRNIVTSSRQTPVGLILAIKDYEPIIQTLSDLELLLNGAAEYLNFNYDFKKPAKQEIAAIVNKFAETSFDETSNELRITSEDLLSLPCPGYPEVPFLMEYISESKEIRFKADSKLFQ